MPDASRFKVDENLPEVFVDLLRKAGHDVASVLGQDLGGCSDADLAQVCRLEGRALITQDLDFSDIRAYVPGDHPGIIVVRQRAQTRDAALAAGRRLISFLERELPGARLWIIGARDIRVRE